MREIFEQRGLSDYPTRRHPVGIERHLRFYKGGVPDPSSSAVEGMKADMANFPQNWIINALAQTGGKGTFNGQTYDFTGLGNVAQQNAMSDTMAQALLDIQNNYGADYVKQRMADLQQSDPVGYAAHQQLFDKIIADAASAPPNAQMASDLENQVNGMLSTSGQLDPKALQQVQQNIRGQQAASGITLGNAPAASEAAAVVNASDNLRTQQQNAAQQYLQSGLTPEDIQFRKIQQDLSNLGAFQNGQTPLAQFGSLASAGNQAAPFSPTNYQTPAGLDMNQSAQNGINFQNSIYNTSLNNANPWMTGLNLGLSGMNTMANFGVFGTNSQTFGNPASASYSTPQSNQFLYNANTGGGGGQQAAWTPNANALQSVQ